jgi:hypothetical protein
VTVTLADGSKVALGIPAGQKKGGSEQFEDIPLRRAGTATEAASAVLAVASPLFSYVDGQVIMVTGGRNMWISNGAPCRKLPYFIKSSTSVRRVTLVVSGGILATRRMC